MPPVLAFPVSADAAGRLVTVESGTSAHAEQAVAIISGTVQGERVVKPAFGVPDPVGEVEYDADNLIAAVARWAPFAEVVDVRQSYAADDPLALDVTVRVRRG